MVYWTWTYIFVGLERHITFASQAIGITNKKPNLNFLKNWTSIFNARKDADETLLTAVGKRSASLRFLNIDD